MDSVLLKRAHGCDRQTDSHVDHYWLPHDSLPGQYPSGLLLSLQQSYSDQEAEKKT